MSASFDPFRLDQKFEPEPVGCALSPVRLVDEDELPPTRRPYWLKLIVWALAGMLAVSSLLTTGETQRASSPEEAQ
jgi:hypothetical protein